MASQAQVMAVQGFSFLLRFSGKNLHAVLLGAPKPFRELYDKASLVERHELQYIATAAVGVAMKSPLFK